ncbi:hypothetical protein ACET3Z_023572 [Daucus carota]
MTMPNMSGPAEQMSLADHPVKGFYLMVVGVPQVGWKKLCKHKMEARTNHISEFLRRIQTNDSTSPSPTYLAQHPLFDQACISSDVYKLLYRILRHL